MATGRTKPKHTRVYVDGYDMSGQTRTIGPLDWSYDEPEFTCLSDSTKGYLPGQPQINVGTLNGVFDNTASTGGHTTLITAGAVRTVLVAQGIRGAPAQGDPCFGGQFTQAGYQATSEGGTYLTVPFSGWAGNATSLLYGSPWGTLLHENTVRLSATGANTDVGFDNLTGAATSKGGYMVYMVTAGNGTATLNVQDAAVNNDGGFADLAGCTTGSINCALIQHGIVVPTTQTVRQFLRWQITFGSATAVYFVIAFMRRYQ